MNVADELAKLAQLREQGVLNEAEFEQQKAAVLAGSHPATPEAAHEAPGKKKMGKGCLIAIAVIVVLLIIAAVAGGGNKGATVNGPTIGNEAAPAAAAASDDAAPSLTMDGYNRVKNGMTFEQVKAIIGEPSQELTRNEMAGTETIMYQWDGSLGANMNAMFQNGKLVQKAQFGLR